MFTSSYKGRIVSKGGLLFKRNVSKEGAIEKETNTGPTLNDRKIKITERERGNMKNPQKQGVHNIYLDSYQRQNSKRVDL